MNSLIVTHFQQAKLQSSQMQLTEKNRFQRNSKLNFRKTCAREEKKTFKLQFKWVAPYRCFQN